MKLKIYRNKLLIITTMISTIIYLCWRVFFTIPFGESFFALVWGIVLLLFEFIGMIEAFIHFKNMSNIDYPEKPKIRDEDYVDVDVFVATYNESIDLLYKTINGCLNMDYPDKGKVHIYICDDSNRREMKDLAERLDVNYITRRERKDAKAGNYNNALRNTKSPLIVTFDADMIPMHDFLTTCVPYFYLEEKVGFVQTPQSFYNPDLFQYNLFSEGRIPNEQDYFYRDIQVSRNKSNSVIYGGSNTIISRKALEEVGGFYTKVITEDFATGMLIQSKGYKCYATNEIHASGLSPSDLKSLVKQRERWARGCIQSGRKLNIFFRKGLNFEQKLSYITAITYWYFCLKRFVYIMSPIFFSVFNIIVVKCTIQEVLLFWLPMYIFYSASLKKLSNNIRSSKWTSVYETILFPSLAIPVLIETFGVTQKKFWVTKKDRTNSSDKFYRIKSALPLIILAILSVIGINKGIINIFSIGSPMTIVSLFWLVFNLYTIIMSIFFMLGREAFRKSERFIAKMDCVISYEDKKIKSITRDISENGISVILDSPMYLPYDREINLTINTDRYKASFLGKIVHVGEGCNKWKYAFSITHIDEKNYRQLLNITYDREPSLPQNIEKYNSVFDDISINILKRGKSPVYFNRKLPRINLNKIIDSEECGEVTIVNFNYEYAIIKLRKTIPNVIKINVNKDIVLDLTFKKEIVSDKNDMKEALYYINNNKEIAESKTFWNILLGWREEYEIDIENKREGEKKRKKNEVSDEFDETKYI